MRVPLLVLLLLGAVAYCAAEQTEFQYGFEDSDTVDALWIAFVGSTVTETTAGEHAGGAYDGDNLGVMTTDPAGITGTYHFFTQTSATFDTFPINPETTQRVAQTVYLDTDSTSSGVGPYANADFAYTVAVNQLVDGSYFHRRDFIFGCILEDGWWKCVASNNVDYDTNKPPVSGATTPITNESGWFIFEHNFVIEAGALSVYMHIRDTEGNIVASWRRRSESDTPDVVAGLRYAWFARVRVNEGLALDSVGVTPVPEEEVGGIGAGSCFNEGTYQSCAEPACRAIVCETHAACCVTEWTQECAYIASLKAECTRDNDVCQRALNLEYVTADGFTANSHSLSATVTTIAAKTEVHEEESVCGDLGADVWYHFTPDRDMTLHLDTCADAVFDSAIAVYNSCPVNRLHLVSCSDSVGSLERAACPLGAKLSVDLTQGTTYYIQVGGVLTGVNDEGHATSWATGHTTFAVTADNLGTPVTPAECDELIPGCVNPVVSVANGAWDDASTWNHGPPTAEQCVIVSHHVTAAPGAPVNLHGLKVDVGASLSFGSRSLDVDNLFVAGTLESCDISADSQCTATGALTCNGEKRTVNHAPQQAQQPDETPSAEFAAARPTL